jgi:Fe-S-cluster-containing dehydrogenase component
MPEYYFYADIHRCVGCHACEVACQQEHGDDAKKRIRVEESEVIDSYGRVRVNFIPIVLDKCLIESNVRGNKNEPVCMAVCPTRALLLDELEGFSRALSGGKSVALLRVIG